MKATDLIYMQVSCKGKTLFDKGPLPIKESVGVIAGILQEGFSKGDGRLTIEINERPFDDSIDPASGLYKAVVNQAQENAKPYQPRPNESRDAYVTRIMRDLNEPDYMAESYADIMGLPDDGSKAKWEADSQAQRYMNHQTPKAWAALTPGEQSELKRHMDIHWTNTRFWNGIHRFE